MVIHLDKMRDVQVGEGNMTVSFGGGCLWKDVDGALERYGLATVGGVVNHTGVGGLVLGGGHGWLAALHGLTIDNLISVEVVLADGSIVQASETQNSDLFWALRGAGAQFGIATRFVSRAHKQGKVWSGAIGLHPDKLEQLVQVANEFHDRDNRNGHCLAISMGYAPDGVTRSVSAIPLFQGSEEDGKKYFSSLLALEPHVNTTGMIPISQVNALMNDTVDHGIRRLMGSANVVMPMDAADMKRLAEMFWAFCDARPGLGTSAVVVELFPTHKIRAVALDATAFANRGNYYGVITSFGWTDAALDGEIRTFNRALSDEFRKCAGNDGSEEGGPVGRYVNIESDEVAPRDAYGGNLGRLQELKQRYDPENVFHKWHSFVGKQLK